MRVHRNLHAARKGGPQWVETARGRVVRYWAELELRDVSTRIQPAGAERCKLTQVRSVCAFLDGELHTGPASVWAAWSRVKYDPRHHAAFLHDQRGAAPSAVPDERHGWRRWNRADRVILNQDGSCYALNPRWETDQ